MSKAVKYAVNENINLFIINDKKYKSVCSSAYLHRNLDRNEVTLNSLLSKVLKCGTSDYKSINELSAYAEDLYGCSFDVAVIKRANVQSIVSSVNVVADKFTGEDCEKQGIKLMLDLLFNPYITDGAFSKNFVQSQKSNLKDDIDGLINDKRSYANVRCLEEMCKGESNAIVEIGYAEDIDSITEFTLYTHYKSIISSSPIDIFVVGDVCDEDVLKQLKEYFEGYDFTSSSISVECSNKSASDVRYVEDNLDVNQGKLAMGLRTGINIESPLYYPLLVGNSILGSGAHSKLFNNVREKLSLCYYAYSRLDKYNSIMLIGSGIEFVNYEKTKNAITEEIENVQNGNFTDSELEVAKEYIISSYKSYEDSPAMLIDYYLGNAFCNTIPELSKACDIVSKVTKDEVLKAFENVKLDTVYFLNGKEANA